MLNSLEGYQLKVEGEGTFVKALASFWQNKYAVVFVNYDESNTNIESVPVSLTNVVPGTYMLSQHMIDGQSSQETIIVDGTCLFSRNLLLSPNSVVSWELVREL